MANALERTPPVMKKEIASAHALVARLARDGIQSSFSPGNHQPPSQSPRPNGSREQSSRQMHRRKVIPDRILAVRHARKTASLAEIHDPADQAHAERCDVWASLRQLGSQ